MTARTPPDKHYLATLIREALKGERRRKREAEAVLRQLVRAAQRGRP